MCVSDLVHYVAVELVNTRDLIKKKNNIHNYIVFFFLKKILAKYALCTIMFSTFVRFLFVHEN